MHSIVYIRDGKEPVLCLYTIKYLNESLPFDFLWDSTISLIYN